VAKRLAPGYRLLDFVEIKNELAKCNRTVTPENEYDTAKNRERHLFPDYPFTGESCARFTAQKKLGASGSPTWWLSASRGLMSTNSSQTGTTLGCPKISIVAIGAATRVVVKRWKS
jgi:hypothetical protein